MTAASSVAKIAKERMIEKSGKRRGIIGEKNGDFAGKEGENRPSGIGGVHRRNAWKERKGGEEKEMAEPSRRVKDRTNPMSLDL